MKSIKPGRGPSMMGAFGAVAAAIFGVFWTMMAASMGAPIFFVLFGMIFVALGIAQAVYHYKNATSRNRYSAFDITDDKEEPDPLNEYFGGDRNSSKTEQDDSTRNISEPDTGEENHDSATAFCPYCGASVDGEFSFCPKCGKKLPIE